MNPRVLLYTENHREGGVIKFVIDLLNGLPGPAPELLCNKGGLGAQAPRLKLSIDRAELPILSLEGFLQRWRSRRKTPGGPAAAVAFGDPAASSSWRRWAWRFAPLVELAFLPANALLLLAALRRRRGRTDILHVVNGGSPGAVSAHLAAWAGTCAGIPRVIMTVLSVPVARRWSWAERIAGRLSGPGLSQVITNTEAARESLRGLYGERVRCIHTGIDPEGKAPAPRASLGVPSGSILIGTAAALSVEKGQRTILEALPSLREAFPGLRCVLIGEGPDRGPLELLARRLGVEGAVLFVPFPETGLRSWLAALDVFVFASVHEGLPYAVSEAMAAACPIVATRVGGIPEQIVDGETGLLVPPGEPVRLAEAVLRLLKDRGRARRLGEAARERQRRYFSAAVMVRAYEELHRSRTASD